MPIVLTTGDGTTVGNVVDRVFREFLHAPDEQPVRAPLTSDVAPSDTTWTIDTSVLTADEIELLAVGLLAEVGQDMRYIKSAAISTGALTVPATATNGTVAASHSAGDMVTLNPPHPRRAVFDAVADEIVRLYPDLWAEQTYQLTTSSGYVEVPSTVKQVVNLWVTDGANWHTGGAELLRDFPPSSTGVAIRTRGVGTGRTGHLVYRGAFVRPTSESDLLEDLGVDDEWAAILCAGAAAQTMAGSDVDNSTVEWVTRQLEAQQFPVGRGADVRDGLLRYRTYLLSRARNRLLADSETTTVKNRVGVW